LTVTVGELLEAAGEALRLRLVAGVRGLGRFIAEPRLQQPGLALAGFLPQLHPDRVQVLGNSEISYLATLGPARAAAAATAVAAAGAACFTVTNGTPPPATLIEPCEAAGTPLFASTLRTAEFIDLASCWLEEKLAPEVLLHGDLVEVHALGVLILGKSGIGKSEAALDLVARGHRLVADDVVQVRRISPALLRGRAARLIEHHMEIRGVGVIDVEALFGTLATLDEHRVELIVELVEWPGTPDRLGLVEEQYSLLDTCLPLVRLPVRSGRSMAMLIETATRNHLLRRRGRNSAAGFADRLDRELAVRRDRRLTREHE
jgi:HPr kinase/phosphorylase